MMRFLCSIAFISFACVAPASEPLNWGDLIDRSAQEYEDPYLGLEYESLADLVVVARETSRLEGAELSDAERNLSTQKIGDAKTRLAEDGIDADWLISQRWVVAERRERAATAVNPDVDGKTVTLDGFAIPAPPAEDETQIVYLVPQRGMCSHMPPPNPNQMIRARLEGDWSPSMLHEPVRLTGRLIAEETEHAFHIVDGIVPMRSSFIMDVSVVETMPVFTSNFPDAEEWAAKIAEQARAAGQSATEEEPE